MALDVLYVLRAEEKSGSVAYAADPDIPRFLFVLSSSHVQQWLAISGALCGSYADRQCISCRFFVLLVFLLIGRVLQ